MIEGFENEEAYARMNYLIDVVRGNVPGCYTWKELSKDIKKMYLKESKDAEYVITVNDMKDIEDYIHQKDFKYER
jgi:hypothetical protein